MQYEREVTEMKDYMMIVKDDEGNVFVHFYDDYYKMDSNRMDAEVALGWYTECYRRSHIDNDEFAPMAYMPL